MQYPKTCNILKRQQTPKAKNSRPMTGTSLGPGKYNIPKHNPSPSYEFQKSPRFCLDDKGPIANIFHRVTEKQKQEIVSRIEKNKELASISPAKRAKLAQEKAYKKSVRADVTKLTQRQIYLEKKQKKQTILKDKFRKLNYRMNLPEVLDVRLSWIIISIGVGIGNTIRNLIKNRKKLRVRSLKLLLWLKQICRCIGKIVLLKKKYKYTRSVRKIKINLIPIIHLWVNQRKKRYKKAILLVIEKKNSSNHLVSMIMQWKSKVIFIQKMMKNALFFKLSLYESLLYRWNQAEYNLLEEPTENKFKKRRTISMRSSKTKFQNEGFSTIPIDIKMFLIRKTIREIMKQYFIDLHKFKIEYNKIKKANKINRLILNKDSFQEYPIRPEKPDIYNSFTEEKFINLINIALQERSNWSAVLQNQQKIFSRSYRPRIRIL
ncbi:hypothetical protein SteCoe_8960 [Stentor coeruleus]|uniref:Uncharacterized protein n=1 Tax=Stentor coeruleus TaxID=5963 RepID=A0A1R2CIX8_9CILI|nr:hypothetical protein SteCoe_8960 [Stentor coeruleus]